MITITTKEKVKEESSMLSASRHYESKAFLIYIDSYEDDNPTGRYYNPSREESGTFKSLTQLLLQLEQIMDELKMPQSFQSMRKFLPIASCWNESCENISYKAGEIATFSVNVVFRYNASWQGTLLWKEENKVMAFRSVLELIILMDSVLHQNTSHVWSISENVYKNVAES